MLRRLTIAVAITVLGAVFAAPAAQAEFGIARWEAVTCKTDASAPGLGNWAANGAPCLDSSPTSQFYTQAAGHPNFGITAFLMNQTGAFPNLPDGFLKQIKVELPVGLGVNPEATPKCTEKQLSEVVSAGPPLATKCTTEVPQSLVGVDYFTSFSKGGAGEPPAGTEVTVPVLVYNIAPPFGVPSQAGFNATGEPSYLVGSLDPVDQHVTFTVKNIKSPLVGGAPIVGSRLVFKGKTGSGYLTMPSVCAGPQITKLNVLSHPYPLPPAGAELERGKAYETKVGADGCGLVPFTPELEVTPSNGETDSSVPTTVNVKIPYTPGGEVITQSELKTAKVTLPEGMGLNPSSANGLVPCTDAQFHKGTNAPVECPASSRIGSVEVETPALPKGSIGGDVYVAQPLSNDPSSGNQFRIFIHASGPERGVNVRLIGNVFPNLGTGQLTAVVDENPQAPFSSFKLHLNGGAKGTLSTPDVCGPNTATSEMSPWSGNPAATPSGSFTLTDYPAGGNCPKTLGERPFKPFYSARSDSTAAGAYSPFKVRIARADGEQELKVVNVTLPKGLTGKLAGVPYCSEADIAAATASSGTAQAANYSCSSASQIATTTTAAGSGSGPIKIDGRAFLAGPYKGAPLSMVAITPGVAGPYDVGTVVVRVALNVNPVSAQINAVSDLIPNVFGGVKLDIRSIDVNVDRSQFMLNPTGCSSQATSGTINGGGSNPADPAAFSAYPVSDPYGASGCEGLAFKPKLFTKLTGPTKRAKNPKIRAVLEARNGDANISRTALTLPHSLFLDQGHIGTVCTRVQLAAQTCPAASVYGKAEAKTPLLSDPLKGSVYLVSSNNKLPDLVADLRGQVNIQLHGVISSKHGGLKTVFDSVPDVPVKKFVLEMQGGKKSLIVNSTNLCAKKQTAILNIKAQNGKQVKNNKYGLNIASCKGGKKK
jgi:hypothetical protein